MQVRGEFQPSNTDNQHQNEFNVQPQVIPDCYRLAENRGGYLIGNMRTGRPDFRFYSLGNSLGCLFGLLTSPQQRALFWLCSITAII